MKRVWAASCVASCLAGCGAGEGETATVVTADSAGIELVTTTAPRWESEAAWLVSPEPEVLLGTVDGEGPELFHGITSVVLTADHRIWVANGGDGTIRVFEQDGTHVFNVGGAGEGPGEFRYLAGLAELDGGMLAYQGLVEPLAVFEADGRLAATLALPLKEGIPAPAWAGIVDGPAGPMATVFHHPQGRRTQVGLFEEAVPVYLSSLAHEQLVDLGHYPGARFVGVAEQNATTWQEYTPSLQVAGCGEAVFVGWPDDYVIRQFDAEGRLRRVFRREWSPVAVTEAQMQAYRNRMTDFPEGTRVPERFVARQTALASGMVFPEHHPAYRRMLCDPTGHLWVEREDPSVPRVTTFPPVSLSPTQWDVFDEGGVWSGSLTLPSRFWPMAIAARRIAGLQLSEMDVQHVAIHGLDRGGS